MNLPPSRRSRARAFAFRPASLRPSALVLPALALAFPWTSGAAAQTPELVFLSNVTEVSGGGRALATVEEQTAAALDALGEELGGRGLGYEDVVSVNVFLRDPRHFQTMNGVYRTYFAHDPPARTTVAADLPDVDALIQISAVATPDDAEVVRPPGFRSSALPYSWGIRTGDVLFVAGATSRDPRTHRSVRGNVRVQTRRALGNVGMVLEAAGMDYGDLASCRVFLDDVRLWGAMNEAYREFVPADDPPARAAVRAGLVDPDLLVEIQCVAERSDARAVVRRAGQGPGRAPLSPAISTGARLWLSGMLAAGEDVPAQTRAVLANLGATLEAAEMDFSNVADVWVYLTDVRDAEAVLEALDEAMPEGAPEPTVAGLPLVGRLAVEIQMTAVR